MGRLVSVVSSRAALNGSSTPLTKMLRVFFQGFSNARNRSEERRVGKECRSRRWPQHYKKKNTQQHHDVGQPRRRRTKLAWQRVLASVPGDLNDLFRLSRYAYHAIANGRYQRTVSLQLLSR